MHSFDYLEYLFFPLQIFEGLEVVFEIESSPTSRELVTTTNNQQQLFPNLQILELNYLKSMSHVWKCNNWNKFLSFQKQSSFHNLTTIEMQECNRIKYLFSPITAKLLSNLKIIKITGCHGMEEVVSNIDNEDEEITTSTTYTSTAFFPHLHSLELHNLLILKNIGGGGVLDEFKFSQGGILSWSLCQYSREINIWRCDALSRLIPCYAVGKMHNLEVLEVKYCESLMEVFETQGNNNMNVSGGGDSSCGIDEGNGGIDTTDATIPRLENINVPQLSNLKKLLIISCNLLKHVFTFSSLESLTQLEELTIKKCKEMKVIAKKENGEQTDVVVFPRVKCVELSDLPNLNGFFLGMNEFQWPLLETVMLKECPQMMVFTSGQSTTPKLKYVHTRLGKQSVECDLNFHVVTTFHETRLSSSMSRSLCSNTFEPLPPCSFHNLIELHMEDDQKVKCIIPSNELLQLQKLEIIQVNGGTFVEEVFEVGAMEGATQTVVEVPNLTQLELKYLESLKYIWRWNHHQRMVLTFPNLTTVCINGCESLEHVFTSSMVGSLHQLQDLQISACPNIEVIISVEESEFECDAKVKEIVTLPCLKSLKLQFLTSLKGFCLGKDDFSWPSLDTLKIIDCPEITAFTKGHLATPSLKVIDTSCGRCYLEEDINSFIETKLHEGFNFSSGLDIVYSLPYEF
ncbi:hypothetical protein L1987_32506 [Smallanthus sonchifolius]|uniref:Uncharacterized protein n=1 Tax=Smallanthus sonchifolius TaxID=185202 RepID=A0ACB9HPM7_9ASTR|nr:hypothetical protein L1987_32506 [Smallanthus sonchifolius]